MLPTSVFLKIFEMIEDAAGILSPKYNLEPPHYDGIQSLALQGHSLFSGSRDMCIKKWDLTNRQLKQVSPNISDLNAQLCIFV